jgi:hypothetical protein
MQKPFDIEAIAHQEIQRDRLFPLLTPEQRDFYMRSASEIGAREAAKYRGQEMLSLAQTLGAIVEDYSGDNVIAGREIYAEYDAGFRNIRLYRRGVQHLAERLGPGPPEWDSRPFVRDLLIAHELFHHLESTHIGPVHRMLPAIPVPVFGGLMRLPQYVLRTREIAAHSFAHTLLGMTERFDSAARERITPSCSL